ncbi:MAG: zinc-binding alcohol dehydrogenase [Spirochaetaceae bacterium]|jgi:D-arabinose 1-dehydrogenase-like Zn-dependent alcohol dehydrogenase|nr:zinc-binding alcohol dehydrogenase [Spirochaetaceae bacterium]
MPTSRNVKINASGDVVCIAEALDADLKEGELLIRNEASLISSGTELSRVYGLKKGVRYPVYPGYASIGRIEAVNFSQSAAASPEVFVPGDRVLFSGPHQELQIYGIPAMSSLGMLIKLGPEYDFLSSIDASLLHLGLVAMNGILPADLKLGDKVCVFGLGVVGLLTALLYQASGAEVLGIDAVENRTIHARQAGLRNALPAGDWQEQAGRVKEFFGREADITVDATGRSEGIISAVMSCGDYGQVLLLGSPRIDHTCNITPVFNRIHMKMMTVTGAFNGRYPFYRKEGSRESIERNIASFTALVKTGVIEPRRIISHTFRPESAMEAYDGLFHHPETYYCAVFDWKTV